MNSSLDVIASACTTGLSPVWQPIQVVSEKTHEQVGKLTDLEFLVFKTHCSAFDLRRISTQTERDRMVRQDQNFRHFFFTDLAIKWGRQFKPGFAEVDAKGNVWVPGHGVEDREPGAHHVDMGRATTIVG